MGSRWWAALGVAGFVLAQGAAAADPPPISPTDPLVHPDPAVVYGRLPNGLRYAIEQHASHQKEVIQFRVDAGALEETPDERGLAHFLEHMAFNGSKNFPAGTLIKTFETAGLSLGRDQNAVTSIEDTTFSLDIPDVTDAKLDLGFRWLGDVADGLFITPEEVDRERGVVLSEYRDRLGPATTLGEAQSRFLLPELRAPDRSPIGLHDIVGTATADKIRGFWRHWYRPRNVIVVAVGDEPVEAMRARIEAAFAGWRNDTPEPPRPSNGQVDFTRPFAVKSLSDPHITGGLLVCRYSPKPAHRPEDVVVSRRNLLDRIWSSVVGIRMGRRARAHPDSFLSAVGGVGVAYRVVDQTCFSTAAQRDDWKSALTAMDEEIRRLETYGVTQREFDEAKQRIIAAEKAGVAASSTRTPELIAAAIVSNMVEGDTFDTSEEQLRVYTLAFKEMTAADVSARFHEKWTNASPPLIVTRSPAPIPEVDIAKAWTDAEHGPKPSAPVDQATASWAYGPAAAPGRVASRVELKDPDFTRFTFANGVAVNFKQTGFRKNTVAIRIRFGAGQQELADDRVFEATLAAANLYQGGLGKNDVDDMRELCVGRTCNAALGIGRDSFNLTGNARPDDLGLELQVLAAFLSDPGFRPAMARTMPTVAAGFTRSIAANPVTLAVLKLGEATPSPELWRLPSEAHLAGLTAEDFKAMLKGPLTSEPLEVTIVGDVDEAHMLAAVGPTLGAMPPRPPVDHRRPDAAHVRYAAQSPAPVIVRHEGPKEQAVVDAVWPLFIWTPDQVQESRAITLLSQMIQDELIERIRQKLGKAYTPAVGAAFLRADDQGSITSIIQTSPDSVEVVKTELLAIAADLAAGRITADQLEAARKPILAAIAQQRTDDNWWVNVLDGSVRYPDQLQRARDDATALPKITLDEVKAEAKRWLSAKPYVAVALPKSDGATR